MDEPKPPCPCGAPSEIVLNGLPVCRRCYDAALSVEGSIMPGPGGVVVRRRDEVWKQKLPLWCNKQKPH